MTAGQLSHLRTPYLSASPSISAWLGRGSLASKLSQSPSRFSTAAADGDTLCPSSFSWGPPSELLLGCVYTLSIQIHATSSHEAPDGRSAARKWSKLSLIPLVLCLSRQEEHPLWMLSRVVLENQVNVQPRCIDRGELLSCRDTAVINLHCHLTLRSGPMTCWKRWRGSKQGTAVPTPCRRLLTEPTGDSASFAGTADAADCAHFTGSCICWGTRVPIRQSVSTRLGTVGIRKPYTVCTILDTSARVLECVHTTHDYIPICTQTYAPHVILRSGIPMCYMHHLGSHGGKGRGRWI